MDYQALAWEPAALCGAFGARPLDPGILTCSGRGFPRRSIAGLSMIEPSRHGAILKCLSKGLGYNGEPRVLPRSSTADCGHPGAHCIQLTYT